MTRSPGRGPGVILGAVLVLLAGLLAGCSGVPDSSSPQKVRAVGGATTEPVPNPTPTPGEDPRQIVQDFLQTNVSDQSDHNAAKGYLTPEARNNWSDTTATIVDSPTVRLFDSASDTVAVTGVQVGNLDANGIYKPASPSDPNDPGAQQQSSRSFVLKQVNGQWRIDKLPPGLLLGQANFIKSYHLRALYYFDTEQQHVVPDPRWTALEDQSLASWLLDQLVQPPRAELVNAVNPFPPLINAKDVAVTVGQSQPDTVDLPGSAQLDPDARRRLAAQIAYTLAGDSLVTITDKGRPVSIPGLPGPFGKSDFRSVSGVLLDPSVYYINAAGLVADQTGTPLKGPLGHQAYGLTSIALAGASDETNLRAAGTSGPKAASTLLIGRQGDGLKPSALPPGRLSRPAWAPGTSEVWIGDGTTLRIVTGGAANVVPIASRGALTGDILAVRFSRDGTRIAMVMAGTGGVVQCVVGTVERAGAVRVDNVNPVTPVGFVPTDVAWNEGTTLYVSGSSGSTFGVWSVQSDGSNFTYRSVSNLPGPPTTITAAPFSLPWVGTGNAVFEQRETEWTSPSPTGGTVKGTSPLYQE